MSYEIKKATIKDNNGINKIIQDVYGPDDFIHNQIMIWLEDTKNFYPLVAIDSKSQNYMGFTNNRILGDYLWIEGLRVAPNYRNKNLATELIKHSISYSLRNRKKIIGYATGDGNTPMHKIGLELGFSLIGEQYVINKRLLTDNPDKKDIKSYQTIIDKGQFYDLLMNKYNNQIYVAFFKIPDNHEGGKMLDNIPIFETENYYFLHEIIHGEATRSRGIFTIFLKKSLEPDKIIEELHLIEEYAQPYNYERLTIALMKKEIKNEEIFDQMLKQENYDRHTLHFFEKKLLNDK